MGIISKIARKLTKKTKPKTKSKTNAQKIDSMTKRLRELDKTYNVTATEKRKRNAKELK